MKDSYRKSNNNGRVRRRIAGMYTYVYPYCRTGGRLPCPNHNQDTNTTIPQRLIPLLVLSFRFTYVYSEDNFFNEEGTIISEESSPGVVFGFALVFTFFVMLGGIAIAYFSVLEDLLLRRYIIEGDIIKGDVMTTTFARGGGEVGAFSDKRAIAEYISFVEYTRRLSTNYDVRIRKQMKVKETDFEKPLIPGSTAILKSLGGGGGGGGDDDSIIDECDGYVNIGLEHQSSTFGKPDTIELYVLSDSPKSALPRRQVEREVGLRHRLATFALLVVIFALAAFCTHVAAEALVDMRESNGQLELKLYTIVIFLFVVVIEVPLVHYCFRGPFSNTLKEEYLESGEFVTMHRDYSSLASLASGSDTVLVIKPSCTSPVASTVGLILSESESSDEGTVEEKRAKAPVECSV